MCKKTNLLRPQQGWILSVLAAVGVALLGSCASGYESPDGFDVGVSNQQLVTPDSVSFSLNSAGDEMTISWPLVMGALGYEVTITNVDDPENITIVDKYDHYMVDGCKIAVPVSEDSNYKLAIRVLGNPEYNNIDAAEATVYDFTTGVPSVMTIPSGSDIYEYMQANPLDSTTIDQEVAIDLEIGGEYTCSGPVNFYGQRLQFRGNKVNRPIVRMIDKGAFYSYSGLGVKYINFDFTESTAQSFLFFSADSLPDNIKSQNLGYTRRGGLINNVYIVQDEVYFRSCMFKNLPNAIIHDNEVSCAYWNFDMYDCIIQGNNSGSVGLICLQKAGRMIKNTSIRSCTIYNIVDNSQAYFMRWSNSSNSNPEKTFGDVSSYYASQSITFMNTTFSKTYTGQKFVNNINSNYLTTTIENCIFYDVAQVRRVCIGTKTFRFNFWYAYTNPDSQDMSQKDSYGTPFASQYDPKFQGDVLQPLDLTKENGGVNFTPGEYEIIANKGGDPRWLPSSGTSEE